MTTIRKTATRLAIATPRAVPLRVVAATASRAFSWRSRAIALTIAVFALGPVRAGALCLSDSDCDDGLFCTTDHCILGVCFRFDRDCSDFLNDCTVDSCNEAEKKCVHDTPCLTDCEDFDLSTNREKCDGAGHCVGLPTDLIIVGTPVRCCVSAGCPFNTICVDTLCVLDPSPKPTPTPTRTRTPSRTPTRTRTPTPDDRPVLTIDNVVGNEGNSFLHNWVFTVTLSKPINQSVTFGFASVSGTATAGSDYVANISGTLGFPPNATAIQLPAVQVIGDLIPETDETFFMNITGASSNVRIGDGQGRGIIVNDDSLFSFMVGLAALLPHDSVTRAGRHTPVTLTWTHPQRWRALKTIDLRLRGGGEIAIWLRFDEAASTFALINPANGTPGPAFPVGSQGELSDEAVSMVLHESFWQARDPEGPTVDLTFSFRFAPVAVGNTYQVEAAATNDTGEVQDFEAVGTILVAPLSSCTGDCSHNLTVSEDELLLGVAIALGTTTAECPDFDTNGSSTVEINEIIAAINATLAGCTGGGG